jgi:hypothetical protein
VEPTPKFFKQRGLSPSETARVPLQNFQGRPSDTPIRGLRWNRIAPSLCTERNGRPVTAKGNVL